MEPCTRTGKSNQFSYSKNNMVIQQIYLAESKTNLYLRGVDFEKSVIYFNGKPAKLLRSEHFQIDGQTVVTEQFHFSLEFLLNFLAENDAIDENGVVLKSVIKPDIEPCLKV